MSAWLAPGEIIIATGSPGTTRRRTKTTTATPASVANATRRRRRIASAIIASSCPHPVAAEWAARGRSPSGRSGRRRHQRRLQSAGLIRRDLEVRLVDDWLDVLEKRNDIALFGDIGVDRLPAVDALLLILLAPKRANLGVEVVGLECRMRRRAKHRKAGRGRRIADRVAPVVKGRGRELVRGSELEVLGDLIDLDIRFDADLAPHADDRLDHLIIFRLEAAGRLDGKLHGFLGRV